MNKQQKFIAVAFVILLIAACSTNPLTGRKSLSLVSNAEIFPQSFAQYNQVLSESQVDKTSADAKMINDVGQRIKFAAEKFYVEKNLGSSLQGYQWEFKLIKSDQINAWCMPGGKVAFYTGILPVCQDAIGVAVVMGHEVVHALAGHSAEKMSQGLLAQGLMLGGNVAISNNQWKNVFNELYQPVAGLTMLSYGRQMELDADKGGLYLMAMAGYNPEEAIAFWGRMEKASQGQQKPPEFLSTHPSEGHRMDDLKEAMPLAIQYYNASPYKGQ